MSETKHIHRTYIPHIDGIRCLAVMPVVINHIMSSACPGGFMGVDVFFVISGYLICGGILRDLDAGRFSMREFYYRRARRILPAYFVVLAAVLLFAAFLYPWSRLLLLAQTSLFSIGFSTNIYFWFTTGYFQPDAHENPLLHLWSLGVEEHFYLITPLVLLLVWKWKRSWIFPVLLIASILSLLACVALGTNGQSTTAFYILPTRAWEMLAGALICRLPIAERNSRNGFLALAGLMLVVLPYWCVTTESTQTTLGTSVEIVPFGLTSLGIAPFPGLIILPTVIGTMLLIRYGASGFTGILLSGRLFVGIGMVSYSLYLWHWPILVFCRHISYGQHVYIVSCVVFILSGLFAYLSWRWVENPVREKAWYTRKAALWSSAAGAVVLGSICALIVATQGFRNQLHPEANRHVAAPRPFSANFEKVRPKKPPFQIMDQPDYDPNYVRRLGDPSKTPFFCLIGDSHADAISHGLDDAAMKEGKAGYFIDKRMHPFINQGHERFFEWIVRRKDITDVYLAGRWMHQWRIPDGLPLLGDKGKIPAFDLDEALYSEMEANFRSTAQWFADQGKRVHVFTTVPEYGYAPCDVKARGMIIANSLPIEITERDYVRRQAPVTRILNNLAGEKLIRVVPLGESFLDGGKTIFMSGSGQPFYSDGNHLTKEGAVHAGRVIAPFLW